MSIKRKQNKPQKLKEDEDEDNNGTNKSIKKFLNMHQQNNNNHQNSSSPELNTFLNSNYFAHQTVNSMPNEDYANFLKNLFAYTYSTSLQQCMNNSNSQEPTNFKHEDSTSTSSASQKLCNMLPKYLLDNIFNVNSSIQPLYNSAQQSPNSNINTADKLKDSIEKILAEQNVNKSKVNLLSPANSISSQHKTKPSGSDEKSVKTYMRLVNKGDNKTSVISQILKCLECSMSFETLADLSIHMIKSKHFSRYQTLNDTKLAQRSQQQPEKVNRSTLETTSNGNLNVRNSSSKNVSSHPFNPSHLTCNICNKNFISGNNRETVNGLYNTKNNRPYSQHGNQHNNLPPLVEYIQHLRNVHSLNHICTECGAFFERSNQLSEHLTLHRVSTYASSASFASHPHCPNLNGFKKPRDGPTGDLNPSTPKISKKENTSEIQTNNRSKNELTESQHPLLALQMFVSRGNQVKSLSNVTAQSNLVTAKTEEIIKSVEKISANRLPAKKRPYVAEEADDDNASNSSMSNSNLDCSSKRIKTEEKLSNGKFDNLLRVNLQLDDCKRKSQQQPLHLLQKMQSYLSE